MSRFWRTDGLTHERIVTTMQSTWQFPVMSFWTMCRFLQLLWNVFRYVRVVHLFQVSRMMRWFHVTLVCRWFSRAVLWSSTVRLKCFIIKNTYWKKFELKYILPSLQVWEISSLKSPFFFWKKISVKKKIPQVKPKYYSIIISSFFMIFWFFCILVIMDIRFRFFNSYLDDQFLLR